MPHLRQRVADALDDPALDLAGSAELVDDAADVVDRDHLVDPHLARLGVDGHLGDLDTERQDSHPRRIRPARAFAEDLRVVQEARDLLERPRAAVRGDDVAVLDVEHALLEVVALSRDFDQLPLGVGGRRADRRSHRRRRRGARGDRGVRAARRIAE